MTFSQYSLLLDRLQKRTMAHVADHVHDFVPHESQQAITAGLDVDINNIFLEARKGLDSLEETVLSTVGKR